MPMTVQMELSESSIEAAIEELSKLSRELEDLGEDLEYSLCSEGMSEAKMNVASYSMPYGTGKLENSFLVETGFDGSYVVCMSDHAAFVEFGTGLRGQESQYGYAFPDGVSWIYNTRGVTDDEDDWGWMYYDNGRHWTKGMPSRPFMTPAAETMRSLEAVKAKEVLGW